MKTISLEQLDQRIIRALEEQPEHEAIQLKKDANTVGLLVRLPQAMEGADAEVVHFGEGPGGRVLIIVEARHVRSHDVKTNGKRAVFGAGRGTLAIVSDDDDYLKDFKEYME